MRIAFNINALNLVLIAAPLLFGSGSTAQAADIPPPPSPAAIATSAPAAGKGTAADPAKTPAAEGIDAAEERIPDSVKDVLKHLNKPAEDVTLDDLNTARQAVAKVDILIELEKRLAELDKVRREREGGSLGAMIPSSALRAAPTEGSVPQVAARGAMEVSQISGGDGHYSAIIKVGEDARTVHVGDHLIDGSSVLDISPTEVVLDRNGTTHTLHVKNVNIVFSNSF